MRQGPHISAQAKPPPPLLSAPPLPLPLSVGERLEVVLAGRFAGGFGGTGEPIPYWGFFVQRYLTMYYSHERTLAMQHLTVQRVALSMGVADGYRLRAADSEERRNR